MSLNFFFKSTQSDVVFYVLSLCRDVLFLSLSIVLLGTVIVVWAVVCTSMQFLLMMLYPVVV
jgi:hypothetical protein